MRDPLLIENGAYLVTPPESGRQIIMVGGPGEKIMWKARQLIQKKFGFNGQQSVQLFTSLGRMPPYFRKDDEPIIGMSVGENFLIQAKPEIYRDYAALLVMITQSLGDESITLECIGAKQSERKILLSEPSIRYALNALNELSQRQTQ